MGEVARKVMSTQMGTMQHTLSQVGLGFVEETKPQMHLDAPLLRVQRIGSQSAEQFGVKIGGLLGHDFARERDVAHL